MNKHIVNENKNSNVNAIGCHNTKDMFIIIIINVCDSFQIIYRWRKNEDANRNNISIHYNTDAFNKTI